MTDERKRLLDQAAGIVADGTGDDPPRSDVIDAALTHLIQSHDNLDDARGEVPAEHIQAVANTDVIGLHYRTSVTSKWR